MSATAINVLYVDDYQFDRELVRDALSQAGNKFRLTESATKQEFEAKLHQSTYDIVLSDLNILGFDGLEVIDAVQRELPEVPVVIVTGTGSEETAVEAMKRGAADYVIKTPGHIQRLPIIIQAVLEQKQLEIERDDAIRQLRWREAWLDLAISGSNGGQWFMELDPTLEPPVLPEEIYISPRLKGFVGFADDEFPSLLSAWDRQIFPDDLAAVQECSRRVLMGELPLYEAEYRVWHKDGGTRWIYSRGKMERDEHGRAVRFAGIDWDITQRKENELALKDQAVHLENLVKQRTWELEETQQKLLRQEKLAALGQLAGSIGHELRNPLGAIKNAAYFLTMALDSVDSEVQEALDIMNNEVNKSTAIIDTLLSFARAKVSGKQMLPVKQILANAVSEAGVPEGVEVVWQLDEAAALIQADREQLNRVFLNLIRNGLDAMPDGGQLQISTAVANGAITISIKDTGVGIPSENLDLVFEPLFTTKPKGIGLGLALVKSLVEAYGGTIQVESQVDKGSEFIIHFPTKSEEA